MESVLHNDGTIVLADNERIIVPDTLRFIWEVRPYSERIIMYIQVYVGGKALL